MKVLGSTDSRFFFVPHIVCNVVGVRPHNNVGFFHTHLHNFPILIISDYSTGQLSDRPDKQQDYQQQFGLMNDQVMDSVQTGGINGAGHPSEFSPRGGGEGTLSFPAASSKASSVHSESKYSQKSVMLSVCQED